MRVGKFQVGSVYFVTVEKGEDLLASVQQAVDELGVKQAVVLCGIGVQNGANLYEVIDFNYPHAKHYEQLEGAVELAAINGNVIEGAVHMHAVVSTDKGVWAGHVMPDNKSEATLQIILAELVGDRIVRRPKPDAATSSIDFDRV